MKKLTIALVEKALRDAVAAAPETFTLTKATRVESGLLHGFMVYKFDKPNPWIGRPQIPTFCYLPPDGGNFGHFSRFTTGEYRQAARLLYGRFAGLTPEYYGAKLPLPEGFTL